LYERSSVFKTSAKEKNVRKNKSRETPSMRRLLFFFFFFFFLTEECYERMRSLESVVIQNELLELLKVSELDQRVERLQLVVAGSERHQVAAVAKLSRKCGELVLTYVQKGQRSKLSNHRVKLLQIRKV
jgi:uncharacterized small protein (DUF1192 family)